MAVKVQSNINVVEEERLRLECKVIGNPTLYWEFRKYIKIDIRFL